MNNDNDDDEDPAEALFREGKKYDWRQDRSPAAAILARANFEQAASLGHTRAIRALGHMVYDGRGGSQDKEYGILVLWSAFRLGDQGALEEVADMVDAYSETMPPTAMNDTALDTANSLREVREQLTQVEAFMSSLARDRHVPASGE